METITSGSKAFPQADMDLPFMVSHFDEQAAELVGFQLCFQLRTTQSQVWHGGCDFIHLRSYVNF
jgi:hypothetical protein